MKPLLHPGSVFQGYKIPENVYLDPNISNIDVQGEMFLELLVEIFADQRIAPKISCSCKQIIPFVVLSRCFFIEKKQRISKKLTNHIHVVCLSCKKTAWMIGPDQDILDQWKNNQAIGKRLLSSIIETKISKQLEGTAMFI